MPSRRRLTQPVFSQSAPVRSGPTVHLEKLLESMCNLLKCVHVLSLDLWPVLMWSGSCALGCVALHNMCIPREFRAELRILQPCGAQDHFASYRTERRRCQLPGHGSGPDLTSSRDTALCTQRHRRVAFSHPGVYQNITVDDCRIM